MNADSDNILTRSEPIVDDDDEVTLRLAYERGKLEGYAECFADFRRIVREHGLELVPRPDAASKQAAKPKLSFAERRFLARATGRDKGNR